MAPFRLLIVGEPGFVATATIPNLRLDQAEKFADTLPDIRVDKPLLTPHPTVR